jgi:hypothetical protein
MNILLKRIRKRLSPQSFPDTAEQLEKNDLFSGWWYYSVELLPGLITHISKIGFDYHVRTNSLVAKANQHATELRAYIFNKPRTGSLRSGPPDRRGGAESKGRDRSNTGVVFLSFRTRVTCPSEAFAQMVARFLLRNALL